MKYIQYITFITAYTLHKNAVDHSFFTKHTYKQTTSNNYLQSHIRRFGHQQRLLAQLSFSQFLCQLSHAMAAISHDSLLGIGGDFNMVFLMFTQKVGKQYL